MTKDEFVLITKTLKTAYPRENVFPNMETMELWWRLINDLPYNWTMESVCEWITNNNWQPTIADIRKAVKHKEESHLEQISFRKAMKELLGENEYLQLFDTTYTDYEEELAANSLRQITNGG